MHKFLALGLILTIGSPIALFADKPAGKPKKNAEKNEKKKDETEAAPVFTDVQREAVRGFFVEKHGRGNCPPGLAKKQNGCLPPGQAKKRYTLGQALPQGVAVETPPAELSVRIGAPPQGFMFAVVDGDFIKLAISTKIVVDVIPGLVQ